MLPAGLRGEFELPDEVAQWDDQAYFLFLQEHQFAYQQELEELRARGAEGSEDYAQVLAQFRKVESLMARDFNRRYHQG
jgi:hypothetical protein